MRNVVFKFGLLAMFEVGLVAAVTSFSGCQAEMPRAGAGGEAVGEVRSAVTKTLTLHREPSLDGTDDHVNEECHVNIGSLGGGFVAGRQVRIRILGADGGDGPVGAVGACTLVDSNPDGGVTVPAGKVYMGNNGFRRVGLMAGVDDLTKDVPVELNTEVVSMALNANPDKGKAEATGEFYEYLIDNNTSNTDLVVLAVHGGNIDDHSDEVARQVTDSVGPYGQTSHVTGYEAYGYSKDDNTNANAHWHITSAAINPESYPKLKSISSRGFKYALSVHGFDADEVLHPADVGKIYVGGNASNKFLVEMADVINESIRDDNKLPPANGVKATSVVPNTDYDAKDTANVVNWIASPAGGVQIELSQEARGMADAGPNYGTMVGYAAGALYSCLLDSGKSLAPTVCQDTAKVQGTAQEYDTGCGRFIADVSIPWTLGSAILEGTVDTTGLSGPECNTLEGYVSIYKRVSGRWERQSGGSIKGAWDPMSSKCAVEPKDPNLPNTLSITAPASGVDQYRITVKGRYGDTVSQLVKLPAIASYTRVGEAEATCQCSAEMPCHVEAYTCQTCDCLALGQGQSAPSCGHAPPISCAIWPCTGYAAACIAGKCVLQSTNTQQ